MVTWWALSVDRLTPTKKEKNKLSAPLANGEGGRAGAGCARALLLLLLLLPAAAAVLLLLRCAAAAADVLRCAALLCQVLHWLTRVC
jgi:hypothetical protein